ncbi:hypothetical protein FNH09_08290 [Streptomyces adustus]|uniref:Uncharacterized protein n=1 Tax=Streptomyces adustus TaxID=1609272 RepID=A0A5N8VB79_9ACTN|nr:hypothetical protein [Streptomyces adustus]MPY31298.1 hypothetical protein [Streptomyces adustus]
MTSEGETAGRFRPKDSGDDSSRGERHRVLAEALNHYGLWDHLPAEQRGSAMADVAAGSYPLRLGLLLEQIVFWADGEELAEGGVEEFLRTLAPALARCGVVLEVETIRDTDDYTVSINGTRYVVLRPEDREHGDSWALATVRPLAVVNRLLAAAGRSPLRVHTLHTTGGNDGLALLMDPRAAEAMRASGLFSEHNVPKPAEWE